ncbi:aminotransferase class IV family protein [Solirhodobacter olei]|uniref:aminotransferase class IV family protein n=1 Tax=Solirhodobacter olei TaxID=2493082 RepID=UPI000FDC6912|nr:aminotransferase class IV family protein [Solirhodobacter olei]
MEDALRNLSEHDLIELELIETLRFTSGFGYTRLDLHLGRMERSAAALHFPFQRRDALSRLEQVNGPGAHRVRLVLRHDGSLSLSSGPLQPNPDHWRVAIGKARLDAADPWLRHKTSRRALYDQTRAELPDGVDEVLFCNRDGFLCEGTITNIFVQRGGRLLTPPPSAGLLPGVLRQELLASARATEADLWPIDLDNAEAIFVGNSLRGLIPARRV